MLSTAAPPVGGAVAGEGVGILDALESGGCVTLPDGTDLVLGHLAFSAAEEQFVLPPDHGDPPEFVAMASEFADVLAGPPPGLPPDQGTDFELRIDRRTPARTLCPVPVR
jgi:hypothetical protein